VTCSLAGHSQQRLERGIGDCSGDQGEVEGADAERGTKVGNRLVEERHDLANVCLAITEVGPRPVREDLPRILGNLEASSAVWQQGDLVQHPCDVATELLKLFLATRVGIPLRPCGG
jgi:hypothetical protein